MKMLHQFKLGLLPLPHTPSPNQLRCLKKIHHISTLQWMANLFGSAEKNIGGRGCEGEEGNGGMWRRNTLDKWEG